MINTDGETKNLPSESGENNLGIQFQSNLKFDQHITTIVNKANQLLGLIKRSFCYMDKTLFLKLYKSLIRPHLDYGNSVWYPVTKKNKQLIENVQRRATRLVPDLRDLSYEERLYNLNLPTLEYCRKRGDLIQLYKMIHGIDDIDVTKFVSFSTNTTRGHTLKLNKP